MSKTSLCFVSPTAYPVLSGQPHLGQIGGADVQQALVARELARRGYDISFVTYDHGQPDGMDCAGVQVFKMCRPRAGLPAVRFLHPAWTSLWHAMTRANASVYYQRTAACETGQCALWCRLNRRRFIFAVASDTDCDPRDTSLGTHLDRWLFRAGIRLADRVIAQTRSQYARLRGGFGLEPVLIGSCGAEPTDAMKPADFSAARARRLLWIGRISPKKGFELLLDFAGAAPEFVFDVVTDTRTNSDYAKRLLAHARMLPNIAVHGQMPPARTAEFYDRAGLFTCTSLVEGF